MISDLLRRFILLDPIGCSFAADAVSRTVGGSRCVTEESGAGGFDGCGTSFVGGTRFFAGEPPESVAPDVAGLSCRLTESRPGPIRVGGTSNSSRAGLASAAGAGAGLVSCAQTCDAPTADTTANR